MKKFWRILAIVLALALFLVGCSGNAGNNANEDKSATTSSDSTASSVSKEDSSSAPAADNSEEKRDLEIRFIAMGTGTPYWDAVYQGMLDCADDHASEWGNVKITFEGPQNSNVDEQIGMVENATAAGVDAILCTPLSSESLHDCLVAAEDAGVIVIDGDNILAEMDVSAYFGSNALNMTGKLAETLIGEGKIDTAGNYIIVVPNPDMQQMQDRMNGFSEYLSANETGWTYKGQFVPTDSTVEAGMNVVQNVLTGGEVDLVFGATDYMGTAALNIVTQSGISDVAICSLDCNESLLEGLRDGRVAALALQMPYNQGYYGMEAIFTLLNGGTVEKINDVGSFILTKENMDTPEGIAAISQYISGYTG